MQNPLREQQRSKQSAFSAPGVGLKKGASYSNIEEMREMAKGLTYPHRLSFYDCPPIEEISMEDFELYAVDRLRVLKALENATLSSKTEEEFKAVVSDSQKKHLPMSSLIQLKNGINVDSERRKDHISHFILRLAYCRSEDLRAWLVRYETMLFKYRYEILSSEEKIMFLESCNISFKPISFDDRMRLAECLMDSTFGLNEDNIAAENFFMVSFDKVPDLVSRRDCYVEAGFAYVPQSSLISLLLAEFKNELLRGLELTAKAFPKIDSDDRLKPMLNALSKQYLGQDYGVKSGAVMGQVKHNEIDGLAPLFAPCMRYLHGQLRKEKHLKHSGRMQYGLFLKGLGLTMEEALIFWRQSFSNMTDDKFQKGGYAYNIRHNYGKEGKRANYTPYGCMKIITSQPSAGDHHGCPFKHFSVDNLLKLLSEYGINEEQKKEIAALARSGHFQLACTKYGEIIRARRIEEDGNFMAKEIPVEFINHPNQFFDYAAQAAGLTKEEKDDEVQR